MSVGYYELDSPWPRAALTVLSILLAVGGGVMAVPLGRQRVRGILVGGAAVACAVGLWLGSAGMLGILMAVIFLLLPSVAVGSVLVVWRRTRLPGTLILLVTAVTFAAALAVVAHFPRGPEL